MVVLQLHREGGRERGCSFVAASLEVAARKIGLTRRALKKLVRQSGKEAAHCSRWIYLLSRKREWEMREV